MTYFVVRSLVTGEFAMLANGTINRCCLYRSARAVRNSLMLADPLKVWQVKKY